MAEPIDAKSIFLSAVEMTSQADRDAYLDKVCGNHSDLRQRVEALLAAHDQPASFLDRPVVDFPPSGPEAPTLPPSPVTEGPGTVIGPYKLLQQIGEGGMGVVYMAGQQEPMRRQVALKIIKPGMDS